MKQRITKQRLESLIERATAKVFEDPDAEDLDVHELTKRWAHEFCLLRDAEKEICGS